MQLVHQKYLLTFNWKFYHKALKGFTIKIYNIQSKSFSQDIVIMLLFREEKLSILWSPQDI